jgi:hypothetical protein
MNRLMKLNIKCFGKGDKHENLVGSKFYVVDTICYRYDLSFK